MSSEDKGTKWLYGIGGAAIGGLVGYFLDHHARDDDEDRPPILVKDGSLIFESGDAAGETEEQTGKPWDGKGNDWQPVHPQGKATKWFVVEILPSSAGCPAISMTKKIEITYGAKKFTIEARPEFGAKGKKVPTVSGPDLCRDGSTANPALIHDKGGSGKIEKVEFKTKDGDSITCSSLTTLRIWQF